MSHKYLLIGLIFFAVLESCNPKGKKKENPPQPTPTEVVVINQPVFKLTSAQEEQLRNIGKSNAIDRCNSMARLDSPMEPYGFATEYTYEKGEKQKIQMQIRPLPKWNCLTDGRSLEFLMGTGTQSEGTADLKVSFSASLKFIPVETGVVPAISFLSSCGSEVQDGLIAAQQKLGESLDDVKKQKLRRAAVEEICPQIFHETTNYIITLLSK